MTSSLSAVEKLASAQPDRFEGFARSLTAYRDDLRGLAAQLRRQTRQTEQWQGATADTARARVVATVAALGAMADELDLLANSATQYARSLDTSAALARDGLVRWRLAGWLAPLRFSGLPGMLYDRATMDIQSALQMSSLNAVKFRQLADGALQRMRGGVAPIRPQ